MSAILFPYYSRECQNHLRAAKKASCIGALGHRSVALIEAIPILGIAAVLIERIVRAIFNALREIKTRCLTKTYTSEAFAEALERGNIILRAGHRIKITSPDIESYVKEFDSHEVYSFYFREKNEYIFDQLVGQVLINGLLNVSPYLKIVGKDLILSSRTELLIKKDKPKTIFLDSNKLKNDKRSHLTFLPNQKIVLMGIEVKRIPHTNMDDRVDAKNQVKRFFYNNSPSGLCWDLNFEGIKISVYRNMSVVEISSPVKLEIVLKKADYFELLMLNVLPLVPDLTKKILANDSKAISHILFLALWEAIDCSLKNKDYKVDFFKDSTLEELRSVLANEGFVKAFQALTEEDSESVRECLQSLETFDNLNLLESPNLRLVIPIIHQLIAKEKRGGVFIPTLQELLRTPDR